MAELKARLLKAITLQQCCFCIDIKTGSILSGIWTLVAGLLSASFQILNLQTIHRLTSIQQDDLPISLHVFYVLAAVQITVGTITIILSGLLLCGIYKGNIKLFTPWMVWVATHEAIDIGIFIFYIATGVSVGLQVYVGDAVILVLDLYCVMCVYSYFKKLKRSGIGQHTDGFNLPIHRRVTYTPLARETPCVPV